MTDLRDLYQDVILDHNKKPRNFGRLEAHNHDAHGHNPLCGDDYEIFVLVHDGVVKDISFDGAGCAISKAAASMMTSKVKGKSVEEAQQFIEEFRDMMAGHLDESGREHLGHLRVFEGVAQLPNRIKCAVLPWHTLNAALVGSEIASTEGDHDEWERA
ncbi:MAG: SUF system NifU family Fe-S cluster assembly protein [bacterium]